MTASPECLIEEDCGNVKLLLKVGNKQAVKAVIAVVEAKNSRLCDLKVKL